MTGTTKEKPSNIVDHQHLVGVADWSDIPYDFDKLYDLNEGLQGDLSVVIAFDDGISGECLLSHDYLMENIDEFPLMKPILAEMDEKGMAYLWLT